MEFVMSANVRSEVEAEAVTEDELQNPEVRNPLWLPRVCAISIRCEEGRESPKCSINGDLNEVMTLFFSGSDEGLKWHPNL